MSEPLEGGLWEATCPVCDTALALEVCWQCLGSGAFHEECADDTCACLDPDQVVEYCEECGGDGEYLACPVVPHTEAQMEAFRARQAML